MGCDKWDGHGETEQGKSVGYAPTLRQSLLPPLLGTVRLKGRLGPEDDDGRLLVNSTYCSFESCCSCQMILALPAI